jgi:hypothetical protein
MLVEELDDAENSEEFNRAAGPKLLGKLWKF